MHIFVILGEILDNFIIYWTFLNSHLFLVKFTPFHAEPFKAQLKNLPVEIIELIKELHAEPIRAQLENLPTEIIELIKEHTREGCEFNQKRCEFKIFLFIDFFLFFIG
jgi:hypothetical protein